MKAAWGVGMAALTLACGCGVGGPQSAQRVRVEVTEAGFVPSVVQVEKGRPVIVTFARRAGETCATDVVFRSLHRGYDLPLNKDVSFTLKPAEIGDTLRFSCSMNMLQGMFVAK